MKHLDSQLAKFREPLVSEVRLTDIESSKVATLVASEVRFLSEPAKAAVAAASWVPIRARLNQLRSFQRWSEFAQKNAKFPEIGHARLIVQNYICFTYLKDACFEVLGRSLDGATVAARCSHYLSSGKLRDFRNAFSHSNWCLSDDAKALDCWVAVDARRPNGAHRAFQVRAVELDFWQSLSRGVAYATYENLGA